MRRLDARIVVERPAFRLDVALTIPDGGVLVVLGPNGSGKSTLLAALAGVEPLGGGFLRTADRVLDDHGAGIHVDSARRSIGWVHQDGALFPHLSVRENVAFGLRARGIARRDAWRIADEWLDRLGVAALATARPAEISGGQAQRVAIARALAADAQLLLLDEPLSAVDAEARSALRADLGDRLRSHEGWTVLVTHDAADVELGDEVLVLEAGAAVQRGTLAELRSAPATPYIASMLGA